ncbi:MAG: hypothetical protein ACRDNK_19530 [Solirubrobacteraceae bacterium]
MSLRLEIDPEFPDVVEHWLVKRGDETIACINLFDLVEEGGCAIDVIPTAERKTAAMMFGSGNYTVTPAVDGRGRHWMDYRLRPGARPGKWGAPVAVLIDQ